MKEDLAEYLLMLWVPAAAAPAQCGMEQSSHQSPGQSPSLAGGELGRFQLTMVGALYTGAGAGWCAGYTLSFWSKKTPSLCWVLYFKTCVTTTKSMEKQTQILSSTRTNIFRVILRFIKNIKLESKIHFTWLNCLNFTVTHMDSLLGYRK